MELIGGGEQPENVSPQESSDGLSPGYSGRAKPAELPTIPGQTSPAIRAVV